MTIQDQGILTSGSKQHRTQWEQILKNKSQISENKNSIIKISFNNKILYSIIWFYII